MAFLKYLPKPPVAGQAATAGAEQVSGFQEDELREVAFANIAMVSVAPVPKGIQLPNGGFVCEQPFFREDAFGDIF